jgi:erythronate-4-phosphate dehydrogenase
LENEPSINSDLLAKTKIATPHIAGYSFEGKVNGTKMIYDSLCKFLNVNLAWQPKLPPIERNDLQLSKGKSDEEKLYKLFSSIYNIEKDDTGLREILDYKLNEQENFDMLRKTSC